MHVVDNPPLNRFETTLDGQLAIAAYRRKPGVIVFTHTEVPPAIEGHGVANELARTALAAARQEGLKVRPLCPFFAAFMKRHPEYDDLREEREESS